MVNDELTTRIRERDDVLKNWGYEVASFGIKKSKENDIPIFTIPQSGNVIESAAGYPLTYFVDFALMFNYPKWMRENLGQAWGEHIYDLEGEYPLQFGAIVTALWRDQMPAWAVWGYLQRNSGKSFGDFYKNFPVYVIDSDGAIANPMAFINKESRDKFQFCLEGRDAKVLCSKFISPQVSALTMTLDNPLPVGFIRDKIKSHGTKRIVEAVTIKDGDRIIVVRPVFEFGERTSCCVDATDLSNELYDLEIGEGFSLPVAIVNGAKINKEVIIEEIVDLTFNIPFNEVVMGYTPGSKVTSDDFDKTKKVACIVDVTTAGGTLEKSISNLKNYGIEPSMCIGMIGFERIWRETAGCKMRFFKDGQTYTCTLITERELFDSAIEEWPELAQRIAMETVIRDEIGKIRDNRQATDKANKMFGEYLVKYPFDDAEKLDELKRIANERWRKFETRVESHLPKAQNPNPQKETNDE